MLLAYSATDGQQGNNYRLKWIFGPVDFVERTAVRRGMTLFSRLTTDVVSSFKEARRLEGIPGIQDLMCGLV